MMVLVPFIHPFRCSACNWRGMMGRMSLVRHSRLNAALNVLMYSVLVVVAIQLYGVIHDSLHPA